MYRQQQSKEIGPRHAEARPALVAMATLFVLGLPLLAWAEVRTEVPDEDPGPPFYARLERQAVHTEIAPHTDQWAAIVFYRSPACVPEGFNLLDLFDPPRAFSCPLTIDGYGIWANGPPPVDFVPRFAKLEGLGAVPVWFVSWPELQEAVEDDVLTMAELRALPSLKLATALYYEEHLHPTGGAEHPSLALTAHGIIERGGTFGLHHSGSEATGVRSVIRFFGQ